MESSAQEIWETALGELQLQVNKANYQTWLKKTVGLSYQDNQFVVGVPNTFVAEYLEQNQLSLIEKTLIGLTHGNTKVLFRVETGKKNSPTSNNSQKTKPQQTSLPLFNPKYTFDSFIVGSCNRLAYAAALGAAENPGHSYNPLFIYGGAGLGKTHLLHAIGHKALDDNIQVLHISAEQFTNEFITAIRSGKAEDFRNKYRSVDMLLVDDIQFISGKEQTAGSFFHTFNELHNANHQIVVTSDSSPKSIPLLEDRLRSRFEWGLITDIQPPDFETRLAILQAKAEQNSSSIAPDVLEFIAQRICQNIRELEGCLNRVLAYTKLVRALLTPELAAQALEDIASKAPPGDALSPIQIIETVASNFKLAPVDLQGRKRDKNTTFARQVAMYLIRQETKCSLAQIGRELGGREPITISNGCKKVAGNINTNPDLRRRLSDIQKSLYKNQQTQNYK